jgi:hypothetical protein
MLTADGPRLIEINPRLVGAKIPRLLSFTLERSVHADLIDLHLGKPATASLATTSAAAGVIRWIVAQGSGPLQTVHLPSHANAGLRCVEILKQAGDWVAPPFENADRIGYGMFCGNDRLQVEKSADDFVAQAAVAIRPAPKASAAAAPCQLAAGQEA